MKPSNEDRELIEAVLLRTRLTVGWEDVLKRAKDKPGATPQRKVRAVLREDRERRQAEVRQGLRKEKGRAA